MTVKKFFLKSISCWRSRACAKIKKVDTKKKQIELEWYGVENQKEAFLTEKLSFSGKNIEFDSKVEDYRAYREQEEKTGYTFAKADSEVLKEEDLRKIYDQEKLIGEVSPAYSIRLRLMKFMPEKDMILQVRLMKIISVRRAGMLR